MIHVRFKATSLPPGGALHAVFGAAAVPPDGYVEPGPATMPIGAPVRDAQQAAARLAAVQVRDAWQAGQRIEAVAGTGYGAAGRCGRGVDTAYASAVRAAGGWSDGFEAALRRAAGWHDAAAPAARAASRWRDVATPAARAAMGRLAGWLAAARIGQHHADAAASALRLAVRSGSPWQAGRRAQAVSASRWQPGRRPPFGRWDAPAVPPLPAGCYTPPPGRAVHVRFGVRALPGDLHVVFRCGDGASAAVVIPVREIYIVINTVTLVRADNGEPVPASTLTIGITRDGPHWTWSATIPGAARELVARDPDPVELLATVNGTVVHLVVERTRRDRSHGIDWLRVSGRSRSALLSTPYAAVMARSTGSSRNAQQLADDALTVAGVPLGWSLDWRIPDWLVPAGAWSHRGSHMEAVLRLAEAGGGYVQSHPSALTLSVLPHYPVAPWAWGSTSPDIVIPDGVVEVEGTETADKPAYNAVYVEGQIGGRRDRILRAGSAGDLVAPQVIDPLATDPLMTRARGLAVLADTGPQTTVSLRLPVLAETGLILPGKLIQYDAEGVQRRGITRSLQADWRLPELWQTIEVEIHG